MNEITIKVHIEKDGSGYYAYCPSLKGLLVDGDTFDEIKENVQNAILCHITSMLIHKEGIPNDKQTEEKEVLFSNFKINENHTAVYAQ